MYFAYRGSLFSKVRLIRVPLLSSIFIGATLFGLVIMPGKVYAGSRKEGPRALTDSLVTVPVCVPGEKDFDLMTEENIDIYLETWLSQEKYERISETLFSEAVEGITVSFAEPTVEGELTFETVNWSFMEIFNRLRSEDRNLSLAIGGWGENTVEHEELLNAWQVALDDPYKFSENVKYFVDEYGFRGIDLDFEFPTAEQADGFLELVRVLREGLGDEIEISMAVNGSVFVDGYKFGDGGLQEYVDEFRVMTYDYSGPWSESASDIAPGDWVLQTVREWSDRVGGMEKLSIGFPTYGYLFAKAEHIGDDFIKEQSKTVQFIDVSEESVMNDLFSLTSGAQGEFGWISLMSPDVMSEIHKKIESEIGEIEGSFFWSAEGISDAHLDAVSDNMGYSIGNDESTNIRNVRKHKWQRRIY